MNDKCQGALEALGYMRKFTENLDNDDSNQKILGELNHLIKLLLNGSVSDFKHRIEQY